MNDCPWDEKQESTALAQVKLENHGEDYCLISLSDNNSTTIFQDGDLNSGPY